MRQKFNFIYEGQFILAACFALINIVVDFAYFNLTGVVAHIYVVVAELILQAIIILISGYFISDHVVNINKRVSLQLFYNAANILFKALFLWLLAGAHFENNFNHIYPFASGDKYGLASVADGSADAIANIIYQCDFCVGRENISLNEPGIVYVYVYISKIAGEFNQSIIWLTFNVINFITASVLMKISDRLFGVVRWSLAVPLIYFLMGDVHASNLTLFKDVLIVSILVSLYYINLIYIFDKKIKPVIYELSAILLFVCLYELRSGMLPVIALLSAVNIMIEKNNKIRHVRILLLAGILVLFITGNADSSRLVTTVHRSVDKALIDSSAGLDVQNLTYTVSQDSSILNKLSLNTISVENFFYAPFVKAALYFLLPLPVNDFVNVEDFFNKLSTVTYSILFPLFLIGLYKTILRRYPKELYLLALCSFCMAAILAAGPMIYPRYRIMASGFFVLIAFIGISQISTGLLKKILLISTVGLAAVILGYQYMYSALVGLVS